MLLEKITLPEQRKHDALKRSAAVQRFGNGLALLIKKIELEPDMVWGLTVIVRHGQPAGLINLLYLLGATLKQQLIARHIDGFPRWRRGCFGADKQAGEIPMQIFKGAVTGDKGLPCQCVLYTF